MQELVAQAFDIGLSAWRRRGYAVLVAWLVCVAGWVVVAVMPDNYRSSAVVYVDTENILKPLLRGLTIETDVAAEVALMQQTLLSRPNIEKVMRLTDLDLLSTNATDLERMVASLQSRISVRRQRSNLFVIEYEDKDPQLARDMVQALLTIFVENNLGRSREDMDTARKFIEDQIQVYETQLDQAEARLAAFRQENMRVLAAGGYAAQLDNASEAFATAESSLRDAKLRRDTLRREMTSIPEFLPSGTVSSADAPSATEIQILELQGILEGLLSRYTDKHPDVVVTRRRLEALLEQRDQEAEAGAQQTASLPKETNEQPGAGVSNPVYEQLKVQLISEEAEIASQEARVTKARNRFEQIQNLANRVPIVEAELGRLNRDYNVLKSNYEQLLSRREAERLSRAREIESEDVQFRVMEAPEVAAIPSGPNRLLFLTAVLVIGIGSGVGYAVLLGFSSDAFSNVGQLRAALALPILGVVSTSDIVRRGFWSLFRRLAFWSTSSALVAAYSGLLVVELQFGLPEVISIAKLTEASSGLLQVLPVN